MTEHTSPDDRIAELEEKLVAARQVIEVLNKSLTDVQAHLDNLTYNADGLATTNRNTEFLRDPRFVAAYRRGADSGHSLGRDSTDGLHIEWRVAIACWAAKHASHLPGDFVECGTNTGVLSLAICDYIDFNATGKSFYLFDTFQGIPLEQVAEDEHPDMKRRMNEAWYPDCYDIARRNFEPFPRAYLVPGLVPDTLDAVEIDQVCYLSIDMNIAYPERAAIEYFWPKLVNGGIVVLDDYGFLMHEVQKASLDEFARSQGVEIFTLPTGQGLLLKP